MKLVKLPNLVAKCCKIRKNIALRSLHIFSIFVYYVRKLLHFRLKNGNNFQYKHSENMQTSQGYIFCILQHFVTKFCNFTDFNKLFTGIYFFLPKSKISLTCKLIVYWVLAQFKLRTDSTFSWQVFLYPGFQSLRQ
jgi:hypothetical protein